MPAFRLFVCAMETMVRRDESNVCSLYSLYTRGAHDRAAAHHDTTPLVAVSSDYVVRRVRATSMVTGMVYNTIYYIMIKSQINLTKQLSRIPSLFDKQLKSPIRITVPSSEYEYHKAMPNRNNVKRLRARRF